MWKELFWVGGDVVWLLKIADSRESAEVAGGPIALLTSKVV